MHAFKGAKWSERGLANAWFGVVVLLVGLEVSVPFMTSERAGLLKCFVMLEPPAR